MRSSGQVYRPGIYQENAPSGHGTNETVSAVSVYNEKETSPAGGIKSAINVGSTGGGGGDLAICMDEVGWGVHILYKCTFSSYTRAFPCVTHRTEGKVCHFRESIC